MSSSGWNVLSFTGKQAGLKAALLLFTVLFPPVAQPGHAPDLPRVLVEITKLQGEPLENVRASLSLLRDAKDHQLSDQRIQRLYDKAEAEIHRALEPFGYYRPEVESGLRRPKTEGAPWRAVFQVDPGPPLLITELDLQLGEAASALAGIFPLAEGDILDHRQYKKGKQELLRQARALGYLRARLGLHRIEIEPQAYRAAIRIHLNTGPLHRYCGLNFEQEGFKEDFLRAFVPMKKGQPYTQESEAELRRALVASGHFRRVEIERLLPQDETSSDVYLLVHLEAHKLNRYRTRFGWGTDSGFGLHFDWTRRNLWQEGHQLNVGTVLVQERAKLVGEARYSIPSDPLFNQRIELFARHQSKDLTYEDAGLPQGDKTRIINNTIGLSLPRPRRLWAGLDLQESLSVTYLTESYDLFEMLFGHLSDTVQNFIEIQLGDDRKTMQADYQGLVLGADWIYRTMDDPLNARRGDYLRLSLKGAHKSLGSNFSFAQARLRSATIRSLGDGRLILRGDAAYTDAQTIRLESFSDVVANQFPELYEFRAGGDRSVRGYKYEELLPTNSFTGGKHLLVGSVEYEHPIIPDWSAAVFVDAGTAFNDFADIDPGIGVGVGARWRSPVGPVRLDLAVPMTDADAAFRIHITIGPEF